MTHPLLSRRCAVALLTISAASAHAAPRDGGLAACSAQFIDMLTTRGVPATAITDRALEQPDVLLPSTNSDVRYWVMKAEGAGGEVVATGKCVVSAHSGKVRRLSLQPGPAMPLALATASR